MYNIAPDTSGSRTRRAGCGSGSACTACTPLQKAGYVKMAKAPSFCTYIPAAAQKIQQDMLGEQAAKVMR